MPAIPLLLAAAGVAFAGVGYFAKSSGQAVENSGNAALKLAAAGLIGYVVLKKAKVL